MGRFGRLGRVIGAEGVRRGWGGVCGGGRGFFRRGGGPRAGWGWRFVRGGWRVVGWRRRLCRLRGGCFLAAFSCLALPGVLFSLFDPLLLFFLPPLEVFFALLAQLVHLAALFFFFPRLLPRFFPSVLSRGRVGGRGGVGGIALPGGFGGRASTGARGWAGRGLGHAASGAGRGAGVMACVGVGVCVRGAGIGMPVRSAARAAACW